MSYRISPCQIVDGASRNASPIPVASTGVKYAKAIKLSFSSFFSISYQLASSGNPDVQIDLEHSVDGNPPVTEGSASSNFIVPGDVSSIETDLTNKNWNMKKLSPDVAVWVRLKLTGKNANPSDTTFNGYIMEQSDIDW